MYMDIMASLLQSIILSAFGKSEGFSQVLPRAAASERGFGQTDTGQNRQTPTKTVKDKNH